MEVPKREQELIAIVNFWKEEMDKAEAQEDKLRFLRAKQVYELSFAKVLDMSLRRGLKMMNRECGTNYEIPPSLASRMGEPEEPEEEE